MVRSLALLAALALIPSTAPGEESCLPPIAAGGTAVNLALGSRTAQVQGSRLAITGEPDADDHVALGVIASLDDGSADTLLVIDGYLKEFAARGVELVILAGDLGETAKDIEAVLRRVAAAGLPVLAFPGNVDPREAFAAGVAAVQKDVPTVVDGTRVRRLDWDDLTIVTLPGHFDARYIRPGAKGCRYLPADLKALAALVKDSKAPVLIAAHTPPLGKAREAVDRHYDGEHAGDPELARLITTASIPFGVFPNIKEAGGKATADVDGSKPLAPSVRSSTLYLAPGAGGALPWTMNDGTTSHGMAAVIEVHGREASYEIVRAAGATRLKEGGLKPPPPPAGN